MSAMGIPEDQMVLAVINPDTNKPISPVTLRKHFREELDKGFIQANAKVAAGLFKNATTSTESAPGGLVAAQIFWAKTRMRWQQRPELNPPPPPPPADITDDKDLARRLAFMLAKGAAAVEAAEKPRPEPARRKKVPTPQA